MPRYRFIKKYQSGYGQWSPGDEIDLTEAEAEWFNRDVDGCLEPVKAEPEHEPDEDDAPDEAIRAIDSPPSDRQVKRPERARRRRAGSADAADDQDDTDDTES